MKDIIVFGKEETATHPLVVIGEYSAQILYISDRSRKARPNRLLGYQPDLLGNLDKPDEELEKWQEKQVLFEKAKCIDLY